MEVDGVDPVDPAEKIKVAIKTLDSQNQEFELDANMLVKDFKSEIAAKVGIAADQQRLIFRGRVLQDEKKLSECNVANNTIHVVQRPANANPATSRSNDVPQVNPSRERGNGGVHGGVIIAEVEVTVPRHSAAQASPFPNLGPGNSAAARLQTSNRMLGRASMLLRRMEEGGVPAPASASSESTEQSPESASAPAEEGQGQGVVAEEGEGQSQERTNGGGNNRALFNSVLSQIATTAASRAMSSGAFPSLDDHVASVSGEGYVRSTPLVGAGAGGIPAAGPGPTTPDNRRRTESPRLREMSSVIEGILSFNERFSPYLIALERVLRNNEQYDDLEQRRSVQYLFDTCSVLMHLLSHSYHSLSDMICDFSTPSDRRRLQATAAYMVETSTVLGAAIPFPMGAEPGRTAGNANGGNPQTQTQAQSTSETGTGVSDPSQGNTTSTPAQEQSTPQPHPTTPFPTLDTQNFAQQLSQMIGGQLGNMGAHIQVELGGPMRTNQPHHANINFQDFASMLGPFGHVGSPAPASQQQQQQTQQRPQQGNTPNRNTTPASSARMRGNNTGSMRISAPAPFDVLLPCSSVHGVRSQPSSRPLNFTQHVDIESVGRRSPDDSFLHNLFDVFLQSDILSLMRHAAHDVITNHLMRGRNPRNKDHLKTAAQKLAKTIVPFLMKFVEKVNQRDMTLDYSKILTDLTVEFLTETMYFVMAIATNDGYQFRSGIISHCDRFIRSLMLFFKTSFNNPAYPCSEGLSDYVVGSFFGGCSLDLQESIRRSLVQYFTHCFSICNSSNAFSSATPARPTGGPIPSTSSSSSAPTTTSPPSSSPEVLPPKQAKQSSSSEVHQPSPVERMEEDDLDSLLNLNSTSSRPQIPIRSNTTAGPMQHFETALRNVPSEWVDTIRHDITRQLGMPDQPPLSPAYSAIFSKK